MMKWIKAFSLILIANFIFVLPAHSQEVKKEKKVKIVTKTVDENGNETIEERYAEGAEADELLEEMDIEVDKDGNIKVNSDSKGKKKTITVEVEENSIKGGDKVNVEVERNGGDHIKLRLNQDGEESIYEWEGMENFPEGLQEMLEELNLNLDLGDMDFGDLEIGDIDFGNMEMGNFNFSYGGASLGVRLENSDKNGALVQEVLENSAAAEAGLQKGDVITAINGITVENTSDVVRKIGKYEPKERIEIELLRNGKMKTVKAVLRERTY